MRGTPTTEHFYIYNSAACAGSFYIEIVLKNKYAKVVGVTDSPKGDRVEKKGVTLNAVVH